jgi:hypothetical protein
MQSSGSGVHDRKESAEEVCPEIAVSNEVRRYLATQPCDYRICTSCGGPILLPVSVKRPKPTDIRIPMGNRTLFVSRFQAPFLDLIDGEMIPRYLRRNDH